MKQGYKNEYRTIMNKAEVNKRLPAHSGGNRYLPNRLLVHYCSFGPNALAPKCWLLYSDILST